MEKKLTLDEILAKLQTENNQAIEELVDGGLIKGGEAALDSCHTY
jgi:hypothetical protein